MKRNLMMAAGPAFLLLGCSGGNGDGSALQEQLTALRVEQEALEAKVVEMQTETRDSVQRIEAMVDVLQAELSNQGEAPPGPAELQPEDPTPTRGAAAAHGEPLAELAAEVIGVAPEPVTQDGDEYTVDRHWLRRSLAELAKSRNKPSVSSNRNGGLRVRGVKPRTLLAQLGFRNNDVILSLNEALVNTPEGLARELANAESPLLVKIQRRNEELTQTYRFR